jgi:LysR family glycine cleavage system transcriptional activator
MATFRNDGIDGAIRYADGEDGFDGLDSVLLYHIQLFAVASPAYIAEHGKLESLAEPGTHHLIDGTTSTKTGGFFKKWRDVVSGNQLDSTVQHESFPDYDQILNAAVLGRGIALLTPTLVLEEIAAGNLEYAHPEPVPTPWNCYFVSPANARPNDDLIAFRDWLVESLKKYGTVENKGPSKTKSLT